MFGFFLQRPYLHLLVALGCGVALGERYALPEEMLAHDRLLIWLSLLSLLLVWWLRRDDRQWRQHLPGLALLVLIGFVSASLAVRLPLTAPLRQYVSREPVALRGTVRSMPKHQRGHLRFLLEVRGVGGGGGKRGGGSLGSVYCYVKCDPETPLYYNDAIRLSAALEEAPPARNFGQFDYRRYLMQRGTVLTAYAASAGNLRRITGPDPAPWSWLAGARRAVMRNLTQRLPPDYGELAVSVVYGDKITDLPEQIEERFRRAGLTHILVASGTQVSLLILLLALMFCRVYPDFTWRSALLNAGQFALTLALVLAYAALTGFETSIARALAMGILVLVGRLFHREADGLTSLAQSGLILLILNPLALNSAGFMLSFGATIGLIYAAGVCFPLVTRWQRLPRGAMQTLITTCGAQFFVAPILASGFQQLSLWGLLSNLIAIPTAFALLITGGLCSLGLGAIPGLGHLLGWIVWGLCWLLDSAARLFAALPGANLAVPHPPWLWIAAYFLLLLLLGEWTKNRATCDPRASRAVWLGAMALFLALLAGVLAWALIPRPELSALALPGCEGYIWRPYTGKTFVLIRSARLERQHNAETVTNALRYRGINRVEQFIWLDGLPEEHPFPDYPAPSSIAGGELRPGSDLAWLVQPGKCIGARCSLGSQEVGIVWDDPVDTTNRHRSANNGHAVQQRVAILVCGPLTSPGGMPDSLGITASRILKAGIVSQREQADGSGANCELRLQPGGADVRSSRFKPQYY